MARVPPTIEKCLSVGLDVATWIKEELADLIVPMDAGYLDMGADVRGFVKLAKGTICRIGGGLEHISKGYGYAGADMLCAAALGYWHQGASCIYLFNYDCHRFLGGTQPYTPEELRVLREIHDPGLIARRDKRYTVTLDMEMRTPPEGGSMPLPFELQGGQERQSFTICVGDDVQSAARDGALRGAQLRVTCAGAGAVPGDVAMNGRALGRARAVPAPTCLTVTYDDVPVVQGDNEIAVGSAGGEQETLRVEGIELIITYGS
jgi:hypothetical protein